MKLQCSKYHYFLKLLTFRRNRIIHSFHVKYATLFKETTFDEEIPGER